MKIDPYQHKKRYLKWKQSVSDGIPGISRANSDIILRYIFDMENGLNISTKSIKGPRSYTRLNNLKQRMIFLAKQFKKHAGVDVGELTEEQLVVFFNGMRNGSILRKDGKEYKSVSDFVKPFKAFWHWHIKTNKKQGIDIPDITTDVDTSNPKPKWVYLTEPQIRQLCDNAKPKYKALMLFMYDTGIRSPGELINIKVSDLYDDCRKLHIRDEIVKKGSFGRKINLMLCRDVVRNFINDEGLTADDQLFNIHPGSVNRYLQRLAKRILGEDVSPAGQKYSELTMYDFRHCSCCYWLPRYKSESALKYRFGWRKSDKIHYYSELLGMKDTITEEDMLMDISKTELERRLQATEQKYEILKEQQDAHLAEAKQVRDLLRIYIEKLGRLEEMHIRM